MAVNSTANLSSPVSFIQGFVDLMERIEKHTSTAFCELCFLDDRSVSSDVFCRQCKQHYCSQCHTKHLRINATKHHKVIRAKDAQTNHGLSKGTTSDFEGGGKDKVDKNIGKLPKNKRAILIEEGDASFPSDEKIPIVNAIEMLNNDSLLVSDGANRKIKLLDAEFSPLTEVLLSSAPYSLVLLDSNTALVNLDHELCLQEVLIKNSKALMLGKRQTVNVNLGRLVKYGDVIVSTGADDWYFSFLILNQAGHVLKYITSFPLNEHLPFPRTVYMTLAYNEKILYITDFSKKTCTGLTVNGKVVFTYTEAGENRHAGVCTDSDGFLYVSCMDTGKVVMVGNSGRKVKDLIKFPEKMRPGYITYKESRNKLFVKLDGSSKILVYELTH